ncbi:MAG: hypothetical protein ACYTFG_20150, partial [Planctomycetota bacterium]
MKKMAEDFDLGNIGKLIGGDKELNERTLKEARRALAEEKRDSFDSYVEEKKKKKGFPGSIQVFGGDGGELDIEGLGDLGKSLKDGLKGLKDVLGEKPGIIDGLV